MEVAEKRARRTLRCANPALRLAIKYLLLHSNNKVQTVYVLKEFLCSFETFSAPNRFTVLEQNHSRENADIVLAANDLVVHVLNFVQINVQVLAGLDVLLIESTTGLATILVELGESILPPRGNTGGELADGVHLDGLHDCKVVSGPEEVLPHNNNTFLSIYMYIDKSCGDEISYYIKHMQRICDDYQNIRLEINRLPRVTHIP
ncbi:hypothetical protein ATCV1_z475R [Acanthocystis turfacea chlorella virus 1]|uniref:Uncharacterized protein z475R n=1 Tax=Chlorovirus heliozoae TaxID=322019 RepID=A7K985_9PHYC|nr:hypothetical protein ATCV1_z475R [Acanthocystis turfacea chlorella virus 1]ABT16609.1 hypothetical protein ATCV1_z475R [Acanthocystis turfacea chlorella virus 1]